MSLREKAVELKHNNYNCCQAVACAFADEIGVSEPELKKLCAGFGSGMGTTGATCGALCGAIMVLGMRKYNNKPIHKESAEFFNKFNEKCGATICGDLKGVRTGKILCSCDDCVRNAVDLLEGN